MREKYTMGKREFGMNEDIVREVLFTCVKADCPCKKVKKVPREEVRPQPIRGTIFKSEPLFFSSCTCLG